MFLECLFAEDLGIVLSAILINCVKVVSVFGSLSISLLIKVWHSSMNAFQFVATLVLSHLVWVYLYLWRLENGQSYIDHHGLSNGSL